MEKMTIPVTSFGKRGTGRSDNAPMKPSQKKTVISRFAKNAAEIHAPICTP